jgi:hypothetical protein
MNGKVCCILGVCCKAGSDAQSEALAAELMSDLECDPGVARQCAAWVVENFDLAPLGSLAPYRDAIVNLAKHVKPAE